MGRKLTRMQSGVNLPLSEVIMSSPLQRFRRFLTKNTIVHTLSTYNMNGTPPKQKRTLPHMVSVSLKRSPF